LLFGSSDPSGASYEWDHQHDEASLSLYVLPTGAASWAAGVRRRRSAEKLECSRPSSPVRDLCSQPRQSSPAVLRCRVAAS